MAKYYILIKRRGSKKWIGAIPVKAGVSLARVRQVVRRQIKKGYVAKIVTQAALRNYLKKLVKRKRMASPRRRRKVKRRIVKRRYKKSRKRRRR